jgi:hypothetical protein
MTSLAVPIRGLAEGHTRTFRLVSDEAMLEQDAGVLRGLIEHECQIGSSFFRFLEERLAAWRSNVARGRLAYDERDNEIFLFALRSWIHLEETESWRRLVALCLKQGPLPSLAEFTAHIEQARKTLQEWAPPVLSKARGLQDDTLTQDDADDLERIVRSGEATAKVPR